MKKWILISTGIVLIVLLVFFLNNGKYAEKCKTAYEALNDRPIHYMLRQNAEYFGGKENSSFVTNGKYWISGKDYLYYSNTEDVYDSAYQEVCKDGIAYPFYFGQWEPSTKPEPPFTGWFDTPWSDLQLTFLSVSKAEGKQNYTFARGRKDLYMSFTFDAEGNLESITISGISEETTTQGTLRRNWEDVYTIVSLDKTEIEKTINSRFAQAVAGQSLS